MGYLSFAVEDFRPACKEAMLQNRAGFRGVSH